MNTIYRTTTRTQTLDQAERAAREQANAWFGDRPYVLVSAHGQQESVTHGTYGGEGEMVPTVVEVDWEFRAEERPAGIED